AGIREAKRLDLGVYAGIDRNGHEGASTQYVEDADINRFNAFFCEIDELARSEQHRIYDSAPMTPAIRVETLKSVHAYWPIIGDCALGDWIDIQERLLAYFDRADQKIKNPSRVMRLPGLYHLQFDKEARKTKRTLVRVVHFDGWCFTVEQMKAAFPPVRKALREEMAIREYRTWDDLGAELRRRMYEHPTAKQRGQWVHLRGVCHDGDGNSALFFNITNLKYGCHNNCPKERILAAFGLPTAPTKSLSDSTVGPRPPRSVVVSEFLARLDVRTSHNGAQSSTDGEVGKVDKNGAVVRGQGSKAGAIRI